MSLTASRKPLSRHGGKHFGTQQGAEDAAKYQTSKLTRPGWFAAEQCRVPGYAGWHLIFCQDKDSGPDHATRQLVIKRDGGCCACCGTPVKGRPHSIGHRKRRSQGGSHLPSNLLLFLGLGNGLVEDDHHYRIDQRLDPRDEGRGLTVRSHQDPATVPVDYVMADGSGFSRYLANDGSLLEEAPGFGGGAA